MEGTTRRRRDEPVAQAQSVRTAPREDAAQRRPARPVQQPAAQPGQPRGAMTLAPELASGRQPITRREAIVWGVIGFVAFVMRFWDVGHRAMHHDESLHAVYSWNIVQW